MPCQRNDEEGGGGKEEERKTGRGVHQDTHGHHQETDEGTARKGKVGRRRRELTLQNQLSNTSMNNMIPQ